MRGRTVMHFEISRDRKQDISVSGLPAGICFLKIVSGAGIETRKIVKTCDPFDPTGQIIPQSEVVSGLARENPGTIGH